MKTKKKPTQTAIRRYVKRRLWATLGIASVLLCTARADAIPVNLGQQQTTNYLERSLYPLQFGLFQGGLLSIGLEFNQPIHFRDNTNGYIELGRSLLWGNYSWQYAFSHISIADSYYLDKEGDWIALHQEELAASPLGAIWTKAYFDDPITLYGIRFDVNVPQVRLMGGGLLQIGSQPKEFDVGKVPDTGTTLGLAVIGFGIMALFRRYQ